MQEWLWRHSNGIPALIHPPSPAPGPHREHEGWDGGEEPGVDHGQDGRQVPLSGSHEEQPGRGHREGTQSSHTPAGLCVQHRTSGASPSSALPATRQDWNTRTGTLAPDSQGGWKWPGNAGRVDLHPALQGQQFSDSSDNPVMCQSRNHLSPAPAQPFSPSRGILIPPLKFPNFLLFIKATFSAAPSPEPVSGSGLLTSPGLCLRNSRLRALKGCL